MEKKIKILPTVNNIDFCGRVVKDPYVSENGNTMFFELIRNFGGNKLPVKMSFVMFKPEGGFPDFIKKGTPVTVHAYFTPVSYKNKEGKTVEEVQKVVKKVEIAELVEKKIKTAEEKTSDGDDGVDIIEK